MQEYSEDILVQKSIASFLKEELGWESIYAYTKEIFGENGTLGRKDKIQSIAPFYLSKALHKLNTWLQDVKNADGIILEAMQLLESYDVALSPLERNRHKYEIIRNGISLSCIDLHGEKRQEKLIFLDFKNVDDNSFVAVRELEITHLPYTCRADIVCFVNGIPLIVIECKNVGLPLRKAYEDNICRYKSSVPKLFDANAIILLTDGVDSKIGALSSEFEHYYPWKRLHEDDDATKADITTMLKGVLQKDVLLDMIENFVLYDDSSGTIHKILARNHQYLGVNAAFDIIKNREAKKGKLGVFWHTQGSGKSYSMVFLTEKVLRKIGNEFTFLICTDRDDLDNQIYETFAGCRAVDPKDKSTRAVSGKHLKEILSLHKSYIFTLIQKFNQTVDTKNPYSARNDIIVISDEAHRTQYGELAANMRDALPLSSFLGFTGTPLFADDGITERFFGDIVSCYNFQQAVLDGATVPLHYDARGEKLAITINDINERIAAVLEDMKATDPDAQEKLERELGRDYHVITASKRLNAIAKDLTEHVTTRFESGKAMLICIDKLTCVRMYNSIMYVWKKHMEKLRREALVETDEQELIRRKRQIAWMESTIIAPIFSECPTDISRFTKAGLDVVEHQERMRTGFVMEKNGVQSYLSMDKAFKKREHPFRIAIVCAMWLTGFDVKSLSTLYLDKHLKAHTLMQAIARANRVDKEKANGFIVDYCGILKQLRAALAMWAGQSNDSIEGDPTPHGVDVVEKMQEAVTLLRSFLTKQQVDLDASIIKIEAALGLTKAALVGVVINDVKEAINGDDATRKEFGILCRNFFLLWRDCLTERDRIRHLIPFRDITNRIYISIQADRENADIATILHELQKVVDEAIGELPSQTPTEVREPYDISKINFKRLVAEFAKKPRKRTVVISLADAVAKRLQYMLAKNPLRTNFQERYEIIIDGYNKEKDRQTIEQTFSQLLDLVGDLEDEDKRAMRLGLPEEALPFFDKLCKENLSKKDYEVLKKVAGTLLEQVKASITKIPHWKENKTTRDQIYTTLYDLLYSEKTGLPDSYSIEERKEKAEEVFNLVYLSFGNWAA